jgi:hypothetical protein
MKTIFTRTTIITLLVALLISPELQAQVDYTFTYSADAGNPGGLNTETDAPGQLSWTTIMPASQSTNVWSPVTAIPFNFNFYGIPVTDFKASQNGLITFDTAAVALPDANTGLPNPALPDKTLCVFWDEFTSAPPTGPNDEIRINTFGTAPNRQFWIKWYSFEYGNPPISFRYFAAVLEETTNQIYFVDQNGSTAATTATVGVQLDDMTAVLADSNLTLPVNGTGIADNDFFTFSPRFDGPNNSGVLSLINLTPPLTAGIQAVEAVIGNLGNNVLDSAQVHWAVDGVIQTSATYYGPLDPYPSIDTINLGTYDFQTGFTDIEIWTSEPNGQMDAFPGDDTLSLTLCTGLSGVYSIGGISPDFNSITDAVNALISCGVSSPVTFFIASGTYNESIEIPEIPGASATNTITFDGIDASTTSLVDSNLSQPGLIQLDGADYITITNLTLENRRSTDAWGVHLRNQSNYNVISNCRMIMDPVGTNDVIGIVASDDLFNDFVEGDNANYCRFENNFISGGEMGIHLEGVGSSAAEFMNGMIIKNNTLTGMDDYAIYLDNQDSIEIIGNKIDGIRNAGGDGIYSFDLMNFVIEANQIVAPDWGIYLSDGNFDATPARRARLINNMVKSETDYAIYMINIDQVDIFHNTAYGNPGIQINTFTSLDIRNNIFQSDDDYAFESSQALSAMVLDYNNYFTPSGNSLFVKDGPTVHADLAAWQGAAPSFNVNSSSDEAQFVSPTDLHRIAGTVSNSGDNTVGVVDDIDGDLRPLSPDITVDMGADEYNVLADDASAIFISANNLTCGRGMDSIFMVIRNIGSNVITSMDILVQIRNAAHLDLLYTYSGNLNPLAYDTVLVGSVNTEAGGQYEITGITQLSGDQNATNDSVRTTVLTYSIFPPTVSYLPSCDTSSLLIAHTDGFVAWYDSVNGVNPIYIGNSFPIRPGSSDTTLYFQLSDIAGKLTTTFANTSSCGGGNMFDIFSKAGLSITGFEIHSGSTSGSSVAYSIYYISGGSYVGNETNAAAWTLHSTGSAISAGMGNPTLIEFPSSPLILPNGVTSGLYVEYDALYTVGANVYEDDYIKITTGVGLCGSFAGVNTPRTFNGSLIYGLQACNDDRDSITITSTLQCRNSTQYLDENGVLELLPADVTQNAFHNCGLDFMIEPGLFGCADLGMHDVTVTFTDSMGMVSSCIAQVQVLDSFNNFLQCPSPDTSIYFDGTCNYAIPDLTGQITSCAPLSSLTQSPTSGSILHGQAAYTIVFTAVNMADDTAYCYQTLHLLDTVAPQITCAGDVNAPTDIGMCTANLTITGPTVMDGCGIATVSNDRNGTSDASGIFSTGQTLVLWTVTDSSGNQSSCTQTITVTESEAPMIACPGDIVSECPQVTVPSPVVSDNCGVASVLNDFNNTDDASDNYPQGTTMVTWIVTDSSGLSDTCMMSVTVSDTIAPMLNCPGDIIVYTTDQSCAVTVNYDNDVVATQDLIAVSPYVDSVYILSDTSTYTYQGAMHLAHPTMDITSSNGLAINPVDGHYYIIFKVDGNNAQRFLGRLDPFTGAVDSIGNLGDRFAGLAISPDGRFFGVTGDGASTASSLFEIDPMTAATTLRAPFGAGSDGENICFNPDDGKIYHWSGRDTDPAMQKVDTSTWIVSDISRSGYNYDEVFGSMYKGNNEFILANLLQEVIIVDTSGFAVNTGISTHMFWKGMALRNQGGGGITATDNCGYTIQQTSGFGSDSLFPIGTTLNTFVATDAAGNADTCSFTVTVVDTNGPTAQCQDIVVSLDGSGTGLIDVTQMNNGSCGAGLSFTSNPTSFSCAEIGMQQAWLIVTDDLGKKDSCLANVMVIDTTGPIAQCISGGSTTLETDGSVTLMAFQLNGGSSDACSPTSALRYSFSGTDVNDDMLIFTCADLGLQGIEMWVWDESDNTSSCITWIQVNDLYAPTPSCTPITVILGNDGTYSLTPSDSMAIVAGASSDGCGSFTVSFNPSTFSCADTMMPVDVTVVFADTSGNADSCIAMVTVNAPPSAAVMYVDKDAIGNDDGSSWANAYTSLSAALNPDNASGCDAFAEIWVAEGSYSPTDSAGLTPSDPGNKSFVMLSGVAIYGGFNGTESVREDRDYRTQITILDGNNTSYHVIQNNGNALDHTAILDGFHITGGNATGVVFETKLGGGMYNRASSPLVNHCTFKNNNALYGGGILNQWSDARILNTYFINNTATFGAGMHNWQSSTTEVVNCIFSQNVAIKDAGAIYNNKNCNVDIINSSMSGNVCGRWGGAMMTAKIVRPWS